MRPRTVIARRGGVPPARRDLLLIALIFVVIGAAAAALLLYVYYPARSAEALARAPAQLSLLARDRQNALAGWVAERLADAELTASFLAVNGIDARAPELLDRFLRAYRYEAAVVVDDAGTVVLRRGTGETDASTILDFIREPPNEPGAWIDFRRTARRTPKILTACRFPGATVVFVSNPYDYLYPLFATVTVGSKTGETNLIGIYDEWGIGLTPYRSGAPPPMTARARIPRAYAARLLARGEQSIRMVDRRGMPVIGIVKPIPRTPWVVFAKIDEDELLDGAVEETVRLGQLFAFVSLMLAATAFVILRSRRMHELRGAEDQLARLYENTTGGILVMRVLLDQNGAPADHQLVDMNPAAEQFFGVAAGEERGKRSAEAAYLDWPSDIRARNYDVALTGRSTHYEQYDVRSERWFDTRCFSPRRGQFAQVLTDITERRRSEEAVRRLSARVLRVQDETQRRIARELHETVAQSLAGLQMNLGMMDRFVDRGGGGAGILADSMEIVDGAMTEVRTVSYLLHPPMIDEAGLVTALRWYGEGFQQRSGIATTVDAPDDLGRLPRDLETAVFRIVQESLTNVQRHSGSATARVTVRRDGDRLSVEIADEGAVCRPRSAMTATPSSPPASASPASTSESTSCTATCTFIHRRKERRSRSRCRSQRTLTRKAPTRNIERVSGAGFVKPLLCPPRTAQILRRGSR
ncbi:MAG TPA: histidine kinase [Thermoanaerobaculia bacterium]|nr:histidine kinase [Thermoanaerobaculia bacterium]